MQERWAPGRPLSEVLVLAVELLSGSSGAAAGVGGTLGADQLEVAVLDRRRSRRTFRRLGGRLLNDLLDPESGTQDVPTQDDPRPGLHDTLTGEEDPAAAPAADGPHHSEGTGTTNPQTQRDEH